jgi:dihydropteroate synthase
MSDQEFPTETLPWRAASWRLRTQTLSTLDHTLIMGILNVTPDSFSDGGDFFTSTGDIDHDAAIRHGLSLREAGADLVDVGGESTRPGSRGVDATTELDRILPVVKELAAAGVVVSIDTTKPGVAEASIDAGAEVINDVTALDDPKMSRVCADAGVGVVLMHMQGSPETMQDEPGYGDVVAEVRDFLLAAAARAEAAGVTPDRICIDPGIGFGKTLDHNLALLAHLGVLVDTDYPVLVGASRKGSLGKILELARHPAGAQDRDPATAATVALAIGEGAAALRVHNVPAAVQTARVADAIVRAGDRADAPVRVAIGLGSNLGNRRKHLDGAVAALADVGAVIAVSSYYETAPIGGPGQADYLNGVALVETDLDPGRVLEFLLDVEHVHGRQRRERNGPRTLDLDLLLYGDRVINEPDLTVPHPRMTERRFVLEPLVEVWPDATLPDGTTIADLLPGVADQHVRLTPA